VFDRCPKRLTTLYNGMIRYDVKREVIFDCDTRKLYASIAVARDWVDKCARTILDAARAKLMG
jgi:hypothetical protein